MNIQANAESVAELLNEKLAAATKENAILHVALAQEQKRVSELEAAAAPEAVPPPEPQNVAAEEE